MAIATIIAPEIMLTLLATSGRWVNSLFDP
jgi:hypothetical protein